MTTKEFVPCPFCGEYIDRSARSCKHCGSDRGTGWSDETYLDGIDLLNEEDLDYDQLKEQEFGTNKKVHISWQMITGLIILLIFVFFAIKAAL